MATKFASIIGVLLATSTVFAGYGDAPQGRPSAPERAMTVMTNAVRMDPTGFRDTYIGIDTILVAPNFWAVNPLYHQEGLDEAARFHAEDMAHNHGMSHTSSDGTSFSDRVISYYDNWNYIGENVATGVPDALGTIVQLLRDNISPSTHPASDSSDYDGHRRNIMAPHFTETGAGYAYDNSRQWYHFWCQDFGRRFTDAANTRIPAGSHFELNTGTISYIANYFDPSGTQPQNASVIIDGIAYPLTLHLGTTDRGTWKFDATDTGYRTRFWFEFTDAGGSLTRYPATDTLLVNPTAADPPVSIVWQHRTTLPSKQLSITPFPATSTSIITLHPTITEIALYTATGELVLAKKVLQGEKTISGLFSGLPSGRYYVQGTNAHKSLLIKNILVIGK